MAWCRSGDKPLSETMMVILPTHVYASLGPNGLTKICLHKTDRKWQDYVYIQCEYKSTKQKIKHLLREENKVKENKIS